MIRIVADTTSTLTVDEAKKLGVFLLPQIIIFGEKEYRDDYEISSEEFLSKLKSSSSLPKTAAPSPALYTPIFQEILSAGDSVLVLCPSGKVSGTFRSATVASQDFPNTDIKVVDTGIIGPALGWIVRFALSLTKTNTMIDEIVTRIIKKCQSLKIYFYVDTLEYLYKGGRIGGAKALVGSVLQIKPILLFKDGQVNPFESQRSKKKAFARIIDLVKEECPSTEESNLSIFQADAMQDAFFFKKEFIKNIGVADVPIFNLPPAIVVHAGPGVVAISFFTS
jgi:DegV family protein with EDD domain